MGTCPPDTYLTDGTRLVQVRKITDAGLLVEEGDIEVSDLSLIPADAFPKWRVVVPNG